MKVYLESQEIDLMEAAAGNVRDRLLLRLIGHLDCPLGELLALEVKDVDFIHGTVAVKHLGTVARIACAGCGARLARSDSFCSKCGSEVKRVTTSERQYRRIRTLPLDKESLDLLLAYIKRGGPVERQGKRLLIGVNRHRAYGIIKELADKVALPKLVNPDTGRAHNVSPRRLRDAFAINATKEWGDRLRAPKRKHHGG